MQTGDILWRWDKSPRRRRISLQIDHRGELIVKTPLRSQLKLIEAFIEAKSSWIKKHQLRQPQRIHPVLPRFDEDTHIWFLGRRYELSLYKDKTVKTYFDGQRLHLHAVSESAFEKKVTRWYKEQTQKQVTHCLEAFKERLHTQPKSVDYRRYKRRWGSCDRANNIMFNSLLSMHPPHHIAYVVAHELAHLKEKHHGAAFWEEGRRIYEPFVQYHKDML